MRGVVRRVPFSLALSLLGGCTFDPAGTTPGADVADAGPQADAEPSEFTDAAIDGALADDAALVDATPPIDAAPPDAAPLPDARTCPPTWTVLPATGHAYRVRHGRQPWFQAADSCGATGPGIHLAVIDDAVELAAVDAYVFSQAVWVGVNDVDEEGHFVKVTGGAATYLPWAQGEPNNLNDHEDCVELVGDTFNDDNCDRDLPFLCECE